MATLIGGRDIQDSSSPYGSRRQYVGPQIAPQGGVQGLGALSSALSNMGQVGQAYLDTRVGEEQDRLRFDALQKRERFRGEYERRMEGLKSSLPVDGAGYVDLADKEFRTGFDVLLKEVPQELRPEFQAWGEQFRQNALIAADNYSRGETRKHSEFVVQDVIESARKQQYVNPDASLGSSVAETIANAPMLTAQEKEILAEGALKELNAARFGGKMRDGMQASYVVPFSRDVSQRVMPALIQQESGGRADALSSKGAMGLTQVIMSTAFEIADALGDQAFPRRGTEEERVAYLNRPEVSRLYGEFYLNQQLKTFGGDLELALIAYNAGPGRAQQFRDSGRRWESLPPGVQSETRPYVANIMKAVGAITPEMAFDPEFGLTLDQAVAAEADIGAILRQSQSDAAAQVKLMQEQSAAAQDQLLNSLYLRAEGGEDFASMYSAQLRGGNLAYDREQFAAGRAISERVNAEQIATSDAYRKLANGETMTEADGDRVITPDLRAGMLAKDENAIGAVINRTAAMGFIPPATERAMSQMLYSPDIEQVSAASQMLTEIQRRNPQLVSNLPDELITRATSFEHMRAAGLPQDQIVETLAATSTPEGRQLIASAQKNDKDYEANRVPAPADIASYFDSTFSFTHDTLPPMDQQSISLLQIQYASVYDSYFAQTLNAGMAKDLALQHIATQWGPSTIGGDRRLMWLPPEQALTNFRADVDGDGKPETIQQTPAQVQAHFKFLLSPFMLAGANATDLDGNPIDWSKYDLSSIPQPAGWAIQATVDTKDALEAGKPVPYHVIPLDEQGQPNWDFANFHGLMRVLTQPIVYDYKEIVAQQRLLMEKREKLQEEIGHVDDARRLEIEREIGNLNRSLGE